MRRKRIDRVLELIRGGERSPEAVARAIGTTPLGVIAVARAEGVVESLDEAEIKRWQNRKSPRVPITVPTRPLAPPPDTSRVDSVDSTLSQPGSTESTAPLVPQAAPARREPPARQHAPHPGSLIDIPPLPRVVRNLADASRVTRDSLLEAVEVLALRARRLDQAIDAFLGVSDRDGSIDVDAIRPPSVASLNIARAVTIDKQTEVLRQIRALETESDESLEMCFTVVVEAADGTRRVLGQPPELMPSQSSPAPVVPIRLSAHGDEDEDGDEGAG